MSVVNFGRSNSIIPVNLIDRDFKSAYQLEDGYTKNIENLMSEFSTKHPTGFIRAVPAYKEKAEEIFAQTKARISPWVRWRCALDDDTIREQVKTVQLNMDVPEIEEVRGEQQA